MFSNSRHRSPSDLPGLPEGIDPPPPDLFDPGEVEQWLSDDANDTSSAGLPDPDGPVRPLDVEEALEQRFAAGIAGLQAWVTTARSQAAAILETMRRARTDLDQQRRQLVEEQIGPLDKDIEAQRRQLQPGQGRFPAVISLTLLTAIGLALTAWAVVEVTAQQPMTGHLFQINPWQAFAWAAVVVASSTWVSHAAGGQWARWSHRAHQLNPSAVLTRRMRLVLAVAWTVIAVAAVVAVTALRASQDSSDSLAAPLLYAVVQAGMQAAAFHHGWERANPDLLELRRSEAHRARLRRDADDAEDELADLDIDIACYEGFDAAVWADQQATAAAASYQEKILQISRARRKVQLIGYGHRASAQHLDLLPLPLFTVPEFTATAANGDWVPATYTLTLQ